MNGGTTEGQLPKPQGRQTLEGSIPSASTMDEDTYHATFLEEFIDHLRLEYEIWGMFHIPELILSDKDAIEARLAPVREFVDWLEKETERHLHAKRGRENTSYFERRELARRSLGTTQASSGTDHVLVEQTGELGRGDLPSSS